MSMRMFASWANFTPVWKPACGRIMADVVGYVHCGTKFSARACARAMLNMPFTAVLGVAEKRFLADATIMDSIVQLQRKKEAWGEEGKNTS